MCDAQDIAIVDCKTCGYIGVTRVVDARCPSCGESVALANEDASQCDLSRELRGYNASGNHVGAEKMMARAAEAIDALIGAVHLLAADRPELTSGVRAVMDMALLKTEV
jgi:hypothetical protein